MTNIKQCQEVFSMISDITFEYNLTTKEVSILYRSESMRSLPSHISNISDFIITCEFIMPAYKSICESVFGDIDSGAPRSMQEIQAGRAENLKWYRITLSHVKPYGNNLAFGFLVDITPEKTWFYMSERDNLTGLYNRNTAQGKIQNILTEQKDEFSCHALLMIDIDYFKRINDTYGHIQGDTILKTFAGTLNSHIRLTDMSARIGGDEFIVFLRNVNSAEIAARKADELCNAACSVSVNDESPITTSIGIAMFPDDGTSFEQLYHNADNALYTAKRCGRNRFAFFSAMQKKMTAHISNT